MRSIATTLLLAYAGELINLAETGVVAKYDDKAFEKTASSGKYLPRLQLMGGSSEKCKAGEFPVNNYALVTGEVYTDLGKECDVLVIAWRPKAMEIGDAIINSHDPESAEFKRIMDRADVKDSGCMFGPEYLVYVPAVKKFATFFCGSKTARKEAPAIKERMLSAATFKSKKIQTKDYTWYGPQCVPCSTPFDVPAMDLIKVELEKFNNPPADGVEAAPEAAAGTEGRAR